MRTRGTVLSTPSLPSAVRALEIMERIAVAPNGLTLTQVTRLLGYPRSSTHCLLVTLERTGFLRRLPEQTVYLPGPRLSELCQRAFPDSWLSQASRTFLVGLMRQTALVVHMAVLSNGQVTLIAQVAPPRVPLTTWGGQRLDWHCTALGKALVAFSAPEVMQSLTQAYSLARHNDNTIVSMRRLTAELQATRERGYGIDDEENIVGIRCLAAPVLTPSGEPAAAISVMGSTTDIVDATTPRLVQALTGTAHLISRQLEAMGWTPKPAEEEAAASGD